MSLSYCGCIDGLASSSEVATFFEPSIISCVRAIESFVSKASLPISVGRTVFL